MADQSQIGAKEKRFLDALEALFTGADVEGDSGFVNLMRVKRAHFQSIRPVLLANVDKRAEKESSFREELFDKLHTFFSRYFCESGSIYFRHLPAFAKIYERVYAEEGGYKRTYAGRGYERVYADGGDVALSWKTRNLYYVKSDVLVRSLSAKVRDEGKPQNTRHFYFDASQIKHKQNNESEKFIFAFDKVKNDDEGNKVICLRVSYKRGGIKTKFDEILKQSRDAGIVALSEEQLQKAVNVFRRQAEVDFFINKNTGEFLREQFNLWLYQYFLGEKSEFDAGRIKQLQALKDTAYEIIAFIAQFENELCRVWEKSKFVRGVNYVVTLDKLAPGLLKKIAAHKGAKAQIKEWRELGVVDGKFSATSISGARGKPLPLDTRYFKSLELEILAELGDLAQALDGELVHSENWQALNTLRKRYAGKVQCIYIDPPYNTGSDFDYKDHFQTSSWLTLMENRLELASHFLKESGYVYLQLDHYADYLGRILLQIVFPDIGKDDQTVITWNTGENISGFKTQRDNWIRQSDKILFFPKKAKQSGFVKLWRPLDKLKDQKIGWLDFIGPDKGNLYIEQWQNGKIEKTPVCVDSKRIGTVWNDIYSFQYSEPRETESFSFQTQKPENLLRRMIQSCTYAGDTVADLFSGTGTTPAVAQKIGRKWMAIESDRHFGNFYIDDGGQKKVGILGRMKIVLAGDREFTLPNTPQKRNPHLTKDVKWEGGGAFKYYSLEQYEETLRNARYKDGSQLEIDSAKSPFAQCVFCTDDKLAHVIKREKDGKRPIDLHSLHPDIDIAETLSNALGKPIRTRTADSVIFADGSEEKINPAKMTEEEKARFLSQIQAYLWWGE